MKRQYITSYIGLPVARAVMGLVFTEFIYKIDKQLANHKRKRKRKNANQLRLIQYFNKNINKNNLKKKNTQTHTRSSYQYSSRILLFQFLFPASLLYLGSRARSISAPRFFSSLPHPPPFLGLCSRSLLFSCLLNPR